MNYENEYLFCRTPHTDPFESLQDYVEGDTGSQFMQLNRILMKSCNILQWDWCLVRDRTAES